MDRSARVSRGRPARGQMIASVWTPLLCVLAACSATPRGGPEGRAGSNKELVARAFERWRAGTGGPFELLDEQAEWTITGSSPYSRTYPSRRDFMDEVIGPFNARLSSPLVPTVRGLYADGDTVVVLFDGQAMAIDGLAYRNTYAWLLRMDNGRVVEVTAVFDTRLFDEFWVRVQPRP